MNVISLAHFLLMNPTIGTGSGFFYNVWCGTFDSFSQDCTNEEFSVEELILSEDYDYYIQIEAIDGTN